MKRLRLSPLLFRRIHKWVGLILGLQFVLWTLSGAVMATLDKDKVGGHGGAAGHVHPLPADAALIDPARLVAGGTVTGVALRDLAGTPVYEFTGANGIRLFDATSGAPRRVDRDTARSVATMVHDAPVRDLALLDTPNLESRDHTGPVWRVDFADDENRSAYVSAETGRFLVMRGDTWRAWDFVWMLHNMDYAERKSFNHLLIIFVAFGTLWLSLTGFYLLFKSFGRADFRWLRRRQAR